MMVVSQRERRVLQEALVNALGPEPADLLMDYLSPVGRVDNAVHDVAGLAAKVDALAGEVRALADQVGVLSGKPSMNIVRSMRA